MTKKSSNVIVFKARRWVKMEDSIIRTTVSPEQRPVKPANELYYQAVTLWMVTHMVSSKIKIPANGIAVRKRGNVVVVINKVYPKHHILEIDANFLSIQMKISRTYLLSIIPELDRGLV